MEAVEAFSSMTLKICSVVRTDRDPSGKIVTRVSLGSRPCHWICDSIAYYFLLDVLLRYARKLRVYMITRECLPLDNNSISSLPTSIRFVKTRK